MDRKKVIATRMIEQNLDQYDTFFDYAWAGGLAERVHPRLADAVDSLGLAWKEAANTHRLPWLMIHQMEGFVGGFVGEYRPYGARLIDALKTRLGDELGDSVRHMAKKKIYAVLDEIDQQVREKEKEYDVSIAPLKYWNDLVRQSEFQLSISGSQNLTYCGLVFGYEWFVVSCFRVLGGAERPRPNQDRFWDDWQTIVGRDGRADYWDDPPVWLAREARNCIAHLGGKAKPELVAENPGLYISPEGIISVQAPDNRELFALLKGKVSQLVDEVQPRLAGCP